MIFDLFRRKKNAPNGAGDSSLETADITDQVPQIDDVLASVEAALEKADALEQRLKPQEQDRCRCW